MGNMVTCKKRMPQCFYRYMNVKEVALLPNARRRRADNLQDSIDVGPAFE